MEKISASTAINLEVLRDLMTTGHLDTLTVRDLIDLAKLGGFAAVVIDNDLLANQIERLGKMTNPERIALLRKAEIQGNHLADSLQMPAVHCLHWDPASTF